MGHENDLLPKFRPISELADMHEEPFAIEYERNGGEGYVHTYGTAFFSDGKFNISALLTAGVHRFRLRDDINAGHAEPGYIVAMSGEMTEFRYCRTWKDWKPGDPLFITGGHEGDHNWTLSPVESDVGWDNNFGVGGYGLPREVAESILRAYNRHYGLIYPPTE